jgi:hypothetical protein
MKAIIHAFIDGLAAVVIVFIAVFLYEFCWNVPHRIWRETSKVQPPPILFHAPPPPPPSASSGPPSVGSKSSSEKGCIPGKARVGTGPEAYKDFCDEELGQMMVKEAKTIRDLADHWLEEESLDDRISRNASGAWTMFFWTYEKCCESDVNILRAEALKRLGVLAKSPEEEDKWSQLQSALQSHAPSHAFATESVKEYSPYLRSVGLELERKREPRPPPKSLEFQKESFIPDHQSVARGFKVGTLVTVHFKDSVARGYLTVELDRNLNGYVSTDLEWDRTRDWIQDELVDYEQLQTFCRENGGKFQIFHFGEKTPIQAGTIVHFMIVTSQETRPIKVMLWPD